MRRMERIGQIDRDTLPDCCVTCQELYIKCNTLACNLTGVDTLPYYKCQYFDRLRMYGKYRNLNETNQPFNQSVELSI